MDLGLNGKTAMVAAASKGIGRAAALTLAEEGARVSVCARNGEALDSVVAELRGLGVEALGVVADVSCAEDLERWHAETVDALGPVQVLVTNTGGPAAGVAGSVSDEAWLAGFDSTLLNVVRLVRLVAPGMVAGGWGRVVHVTSLVAKEPNDLLAISSTLRSGLMGLTRLQARELGPSGITVNGVLPGHTLTDRQRHLAEIRSTQLGVSVDEALQMNGDLAAVRRLGRPEEIAAAIAFLCSEQAGFITGVNLLVDGGATRGLG